MEKVLQHEGIINSADGGCFTRKYGNYTCLQVQVLSFLQPKNLSESQLVMCLGPSMRPLR